MKIISQLILLTVLIGHTSFSQDDVICIPYGDPVSIDGLFTLTEWSDAGTFQIGSGAPTDVYYKHDSTSLLVAYVSNLQSSSRMPELLIDIDNDKSVAWSADDWWFHVSAKDCDYLGEYGNYDSCEVVRWNWTAEENMAPGMPTPPLNDTIEVAIPFTTLGIDLATVDTIGLTFIVTNLFSSWNHWPAGADRNSPATWGSAVFVCSSADIDNGENMNPGIEIYPNPTDGILHVQSDPSMPLPLSVDVLDHLGRTVLQTEFQNLNSNLLDIDMSPFANGLYTLNISGEDYHTRERFQLIRD